jgi:hypothetical protein
MSRSMIAKMASAGAAATALMLAAGGAHASCSTVAGDIEYNLSGTFTDGGTLSGCFYINVYGYLDRSVPWSITTTTGTVLSGYTYDVADAYLATGSNYIDVEPGYTQDLHLVFTNSLSTTGSNPIVVASSFECDGSYSCFDLGGGTVRYLTPGSSPAGSGSVPEPASWALMILGMGVGGSVLRRRRPAAV